MNLQALKALPFFSVLSPSELASLLPSIMQRSFSARSCVIRAGEMPGGLYMILSGRVRLRHHDDEGRALIAETFGPRQFFGEMGLLSGEPSPSSVETTEQCETVYIPRQALVDCLERNAAAAVCLLRAALDRLCRAHRQMANLALTKVYGRVAQVLLENGAEVDGEWHVAVGSERIAEMVGASREMVSRVLRCMIEKRLARRHKRKIVVLDRAALAAPETRSKSRNDCAPGSAAELNT